ncbi:DUF4163 domain-containing protein [Altererythrobacter soli]|uniref:DUF4163 domain-containing protein n=1 Tax=Croceibacterium soli TaxID=1739690 RepID=A0A6I4USS7_9SPHN|nr:DUF4163 domain-containing protein [Croceibacterium soli]MXP41698.1 DUF4163 domain-containing protein [Croceibacterium soli]
MPFRPLLPLALLAVAACSNGDGTTEEQLPADSATPAATATATAEEEGGAKSVDEESELYSFEYSYPAEAGEIPALRRQLDAELAGRKKELIASAREGMEQAEDSGFPYNAYSFSKEWKVVSDLPNWLSLSGGFSSYTGGAHGMYGLDSLVWDKQVGRGFPAAELFNSTEALDRALGERLCEALNRERKERRGEPVPEGSDEEFDRCVGVEDATVVAGSSNGRTFNRITVWFGPYVAGPYAEGSFELEFPVDQAILDAVKPAFRPAFSIAR